jgi:hypothetical protein
MPARRQRGYWIPGLTAVAALTAIGVAFGAGDLDHLDRYGLSGLQSGTDEPVTLLHRFG